MSTKVIINIKPGLPEDEEYLIYNGTIGVILNDLEGALEIEAFDGTTFCIGYDEAIRQKD